MPLPSRIAACETHHGEATTIRREAEVILFGSVALAFALGAAAAFGALAAIAVCAVALVVLIAVTRFNLLPFARERDDEQLDAAARARERMKSPRNSSNS